MEAVAAALMLIGATFCFLAAIGLVRFPDLYTRLHAASKAGTLGAGLILLAVALISGDLAVFLRSMLGVLFLVATAPIAAHLLGRAALRSENPGANITKIHADDGRP